MLKKFFLLVLAACAACTNGTGAAPTNAAQQEDAGTAQADVSVQEPDVSAPDPKPAQSCNYNDDCVDAAHPCDVVRTCQEGLCKALQPLQYAPKGTACDDNSACTAGEACDGKGFCKAGTSLACDDNNVCTSDSCDPASGCVHAILAAGDCDDGNACTNNDACKGGACVGTVTDCDDKNPCTSDSCDKANGCVNVPNANPCDDGDACTEGDVCKAGACAAGALKNCDDGKQCTDDSCDAKTGCAHGPTKAGANCDDNNATTESDACDGNGKCIGKTTTACAGDADCSGLAVDNKCATYVCNTTLGLCDPQPIQVEKDSNPCTDDICDPMTGKTVHPPLDIACTDGNACTVGDFCKEGACTAGSGALPCDDNNACTTDSCDPLAGGGCVHVALVCDDGNPYTDDSCNVKFGCQFAAEMFAVTCQVPADVPDAKSSTCVVSSFFGGLSNGLPAFSATLQGQDSVSVTVESVFMALKTNSWWLLNTTIYGPDGLPIPGGGGGANLKVTGSDGKVTVDGSKAKAGDGLLQNISSGDKPDLVITAAMLKAYAK